MNEPSPLLHYPGIPMAKFGLIPAQFGGGNKYRCIWAPSRMITAHKHGTLSKPITMPLYKYIEPVGDFWIIEVWKSPRECWDGTEESWNANPKQIGIGPYPRNGEYYRAETLRGTPTTGYVETVIGMIEDGPNRHRPIENVLAIEANLQKAAKARNDKRDAVLGECLLPFAGEAYSAAGGGRGTKTVNLALDRKQAGLPRPGSTTKINLKRPQVYEIQQEA